MMFELKNKIFDTLKKSIKKEYDFKITDSFFELNRCKDISMGDLTTNISMKLAKEVRKSPIEISDFLVSDLNKISYFSSVESVKPGFINFRISDVFFNYLTKEINNGEKYGSVNLDYKKKKINYEFISANPTGELHVGHIRNGVIGDVTCNILEYLGNKVTRGYYMNDLGVQIDNLGKSIYFYYLKKLEIKSSIDSADYNTPEVIEFAESLVEKYSNKFIPKKMDSSKALLEFREMGLNHFSNQIKQRIKDLGINKFDKWYSEKEIYNSNAAEITLNHFEKTGATYKKDGALWLKTVNYGDEKDRVVLKKDGVQTYFLPDITNHYLKFKESNYDLVIDLFGGDHHGYEKRMIAAIDQLGFDSKKFRIDFIQMVLIKDMGKVVKMSKRKGTSIRAIDMLNDLGKDLIRFFITDRSREQQLELNLQKIKEESFDNPYYTMQYAFARANQIVSKSKKISKKMKTDINYSDSNIRKLLVELLTFNNVLISSSSKDEPYILNYYLRDISSSFNKIYANHKVINSDYVDSNLLNLTMAFMKVYEIGIKLMGIKPAKKM